MHSIKLDTHERFTQLSVRQYHFLMRFYTKINNSFKFLYKITYILFLFFIPIANMWSISQPILGLIPP